MKNLIPIPLVILLGCLLLGCTLEKTVQTINLVQYSSDSGPILPERQWHEEITITNNAVVLKRSGKVAETKVNAGSWEIPVDMDTVAEFFQELEAVDWSSLKRIEPDDTPDGGGVISYEFVFSNGKSLSLYYDPGTTYENDSRMRKLVDEFILQLEIPFGAKSRYTEDYLSFTKP